MQESPTCHPLRVLHLEDNQDYSDLVRSELAAEGFAPQLLCVETKEDFQLALERGNYDLIIADYYLPTYDGIKALKLAREKQPETPILLVSGTIGEEAAIESLKAGATDYVMKHRPERLVPAVQRALRESTERKNRRLAESNLQRRENHFRAISENSMDIVSVLDETGCFSYNSPSVERVLGFTVEQLQGKNVFSFVHEADAERVKALFSKCVAHPGTTTISKFRVRHADGNWRYVESICNNLLADPEIRGLVINSRDVSERHWIEQCNVTFSTLGLKLSSAISDEEAARIIVNTADELFGWDACTLNLYSEELDKVYPVLSIDTIKGERCDIPKTHFDRTPTTRTRRILSQGAELILREPPLFIPADSRAMGDTSRPSASLMFVPIRNRTRVIGILSIQSYRLKAYESKDLSTLQTLADYCGGALERIRVEQALRESEKRFRQLFEDSPDAVFVEDINGEVLDANLAAARLHGMTREQLLGKNILELVPPSRRVDILQQFKKLVQGELQQTESLILRQDNAQVPVEVRTSLIDYSGRRALLLHVRDISERKKAEEALRGSELRFHSIWENSVDGMRLTDENGTIIAVNEAFCKLTGIARAELEGKIFTVTYEEAANAEHQLSQYIKRFKERTVATRMQRTLTFRSGKTLELESVNSFVESPGQRTLLLGLFRDITQQKRLEEQLLQSQKMDAIGQLAGGVAHDFNNILTVIQGHASLLRSCANITGPLSGSAEQICQAADRAAGLTRQLLTFSRRQMMQLKQLDMNSVVSNMTKMVSRILGEDIKMTFNYSPVVPLINADVGMVEQILLNLAVNSRDAMPSGGQLSISISLKDVKTETLSQHPEGRAGEFVCLTVKDNGSGIEPKVLPHIFEPFFTTKKVGKGTGLGLATVYGIIKQHHGWIEASSQLGHGTKFDVYLPFSKETLRDTSSETTIEQLPKGGTETLLVVEDEAPVRELVCRILKNCGYNVLSANNGPHALQVWEAHKNEIELLLTDIVMPEGLTGRDLAEKLKAEKPNLKAIFTSGYSSDIVGKDFIIQEGTNFLQKPYIPQKLMRAIRKCLDGR